MLTLYPFTNKVWQSLLVSIARTKVDSKFKALPLEGHPEEARAACGARSDSFFWWLRCLLWAQMKWARSFFKNAGNLDERGCKGVALRAMQIFVEPMHGGRFLIDVMPGDTIYETKEKIQVAAARFNVGFDVPAALQRLYHHDFVAKAYPSTAEIPEAMQLQNRVTLRECRIHHGDTLALRWLGEGIDTLELCCRVQQPDAPDEQQDEQEEKEEQQARIEQQQWAKYNQQEESEQFRHVRHEHRVKKSVMTETGWLKAPMELQDDGLVADRDTDEPMLEEFHQEEAEQCRRDMEARGQREVRVFLLMAGHFIKHEMAARDARLVWESMAASLDENGGRLTHQQCEDMAASLDDEYAGRLRALFDEFEEQERRADAVADASGDNNGKSNGKDKRDTGETADGKDTTPARTRTRSRSRSPHPSMPSQPEDGKTSTETLGSAPRRSRNRSPSPSSPWIKPVSYGFAKGCKCWVCGDCAPARHCSCWQVGPCPLIDCAELVTGDVRISRAS